MILRPGEPSAGFILDVWREACRAVAPSERPAPGTACPRRPPGDVRQSPSLAGGARVTAGSDSATFGTLVEHGRSGPLPPVRRSPPAGKSVRTTTVLVADDDDDIREAIREVLTDENGWNVIEAKNGSEALQMALTKRPDALILDQRMPEMTGAEVVVALREAGLPIPVVLISGARDIEGLAGGAGIEHFLCKPFGFDQLTALVNRVMGRH